MLALVDAPVARLPSELARRARVILIGANQTAVKSFRGFHGLI